MFCMNFLDCIDMTIISRLVYDLFILWFHEGPPWSVDTRLPGAQRRLLFQKYLNGSRSIRKMRLDIFGTRRVHEHIHIIIIFYTISTKLFPQNKHRCTASNKSLTIQLCAATGNWLSSDVASGSRAFRLHPMHVRTFDVESMNEVTVQRAKYERRLEMDFSSFVKEGGVPQAWPFGQVARVMSCSGTSVWQAGQCSCSAAIAGSMENDAVRASDKAWASSDRSCGEPGSNDCTTSRRTNGISGAVKRAQRIRRESGLSAHW